MIRSARRQDARTLAELEVRAWRWAYVDIVDEQEMPDTSERTERWLASTMEGAFAFDQDGLVVGLLDCGPRAGEAPDHGALRSLYVEPAAQGAGVGSALHDHALDELRAAGCTVASLWAFAADGHARGFFERRGWTPDGERGERAGAMQLRLQRPLAS